VKNQVRWQFGVLGPPGAAAAGLGEEADLAVECLLRPEDDAAQVTVHLRFLQLQRRQAERADGTAVPELGSGSAVWTTWDEAVEVERELGSFSAAELRRGAHQVVRVDGGEDVEELAAGRLVRHRWPLHAMVDLAAAGDGPVLRLRIVVRNAGGRAADADAALRTSLIGTHLLLAATGARFDSVVDPPDDAAGAAGRCRQHRCWPVLAGDGGPDGRTSDVVLAAPIILADHPEVAPESAVAMFDATEIDEILTLRVLTLTDEEKAQARATDPRAAAIIDRCEQLSPAELQRLHGTLRDPRGGAPTGDDWEATLAQDLATAPDSPETDAVVVAGSRVQRGSRVLLQPNRRADAQDMFLAGQEAVVSAVHVDLDGETHVAVTLVDDPAADLHDWYGRYLYFAPDELRPLDGSTAGTDPHQREESPP
jgi:hypothetical protein